MTIDRIHYVLVTDGSSDKVLMYILDWLLRQNFPDAAIDANWADMRRLPKPPNDLAGKITQALALYHETNVLFVHRDAEKAPPKKREQEIKSAVREAEKERENIPPYVCVIPVRMQEARLLFDEKAIRTAAGNPNGNVNLQLPSLNRVESLPNPKDILYTALKHATELKGRRLKNFNPRKEALRVAELIDDFSPLRRLPAFQTLEQDISQLNV